MPRELSARERAGPSGEQIRDPRISNVLVKKWSHVIGLEYARRVALPDGRVAVLGDLHGNMGWLRMVTRALPRLAPDVRTILQLGDW